MSFAAHLVLAGSLGLLFCGFCAHRLSPDALGRLWVLQAVAGVLLYGWGYMIGGVDGLYAIVLLLVFLLPYFTGTLIAGLVMIWRTREHAK
jgi:hypothetical protein